MNFQQYQPQLQQGGQQSINPQFLAAVRNSNQQQGQGQGQDFGNKFPYGGGGGGGGFNPAAMMGGGGSVNPAQLMNGGGGQQQGLNPAMFQQPQQNGSNIGSGMSGMAMGMLTREQMQAHFNSMSPHQQQRVKAQMVAASQTQQNPMQTMFQGQGGQGGIGGMGSQGGMSGGMGGVQQGGMGGGAMGHNQQQQAALAQLLAQQQQQHLHQHQQNQQPQQHQPLPFGNQQQFAPDRPSSSMSQQSQMMPPPNTIPIPPRPPSNMGSRPGTSHSMGGGQQGQQQGMGGPPSRPGTAGGQQQQGFDGGQGQGQGGNPQFNMIAMNGFAGGPQHQPKPTTPVQFNAPFNIGSNPQQQGQGQGGGGGLNAINPMNTINPQAMFLQQGQGSPPPGSPNQNSAYRGAKRKVGNGMESPRMGGVGMPSGMQRQISNDGGMGIMQGINGYPSSGGSAQQQMMPQSVNGHVGLPPAAQNNGIGMGGMGGGMVGGVGANNLPGGISIGGMSSMNMNVDIPIGRGTSQQPQQQSRAPSNPMAGFQPQQQQAQGQRQAPPIPQKQIDMGMGMKMPGAAVIGGGNPFGTDLGNVGGRSVGMGMSMPATNGLPLPARIPSVAPPPLAKTEPSTPSVQPILPPLPANVQLNPNVTRVSIIPLAGSDKVIPIITPEEIEEIQGWQARDKEYEIIHRKMRERIGEELRTCPVAKANWWEKDAAGMMNRRPREPFDVKYPRPRRERDGRDRRKVGRREGLRLPRVLKSEEADRPEQLVPIRLEFDVEHHKMRDSFVWNLNDPVVTPEAFAQSVVEDYALAPSYNQVIAKSIEDQLSDFRIHSTNPGGEYIPSEFDTLRGALDDEDAEWWEAWRKRLRTKRGALRSARRGGGRRKKRAIVKDEPIESDTGISILDTSLPADVDDIELDESKMVEDMRILIKLDIVVGSMKLEDQFEWDLDNIEASPERFAEVYGADLGLTGEYITAIAHCIREQVHMYQKSFFLMGHPSDTASVQDEELKLSILPSLSSGARSLEQIGQFTPLLNYLSDGDIERNEKEREKELNKRRKRNTRSRRGVALPDREPIRTHRTPAIGFPELDPSTLAAAVTASAPTSRRAAAAAASVTIANMVASENGTAYMPQTSTLTAQPTQTVVKEKKPKGLFKAPSYPPSVLRPRAQVSAPTSSTVADPSVLSLEIDDEAPPPTRSAAPNSLTNIKTFAKLAKEREREAKEKEFADGQHANMIDGVWHCSNCGCPDEIAIGRRKGPLGDKSQCGPCGRYWHRHRRPMVVEWNPSAEFHLSKIRDAELARSVARKRGGAAALRAATANASTPGHGDDADHPSSSHTADAPRGGEDDRAASAGSDDSSDSEPPLAQRISKINGSNHTSSVPPPPVSTSSAPPTASDSTSQSAPPPSSTSARVEPPKWLWDATQAMRAKYPDDLFVIKRINGCEWRIKCQDCPGKLYTPGPGETLLNYEVHLKNRSHRQKVNDRIGYTSNTPVDVTS